MNPLLSGLVAILSAALESPATRQAAEREVAFMLKELAEVAGPDSALAAVAQYADDALVTGEAVIGDPSTPLPSPAPAPQAPREARTVAAPRPAAPAFEDPNREGRLGKVGDKVMYLDGPLKLSGTLVREPDPDGLATLSVISAKGRSATLENIPYNPTLLHAHWSYQDDRVVAMKNGRGTVKRSGYGRSRHPAQAPQE